MRRSMLALTLLVLFPAAVAAQGGPTDQGSISLGGTISFSSAGGDLNENVDGDRMTNLTVNPRALYFVRRGLAIGGDVLIQTVSQGDFELTTLGIGPAVYYYFGASNATIYPFVGASVGYAQLSSDLGDASGWTFGPTAGVAFMLSRSVALTGSVTYRMDSLTPEDADESVDGNTMSLDFGVQAFVN